MNSVPSKHGKVVIAMSGGVDSSVAAALLVQQGYQVIGMMLRLWSEPGDECENRCCTPDAMAQARRVAAMLDIPFYAVDAQQFFRETVVQTFIDGYAQGVTPNPCLVCNRQVRWHFLLQRALALGADFLATGHYVRLQRNPQGHTHLLRAIDAHKDQSYVLHVLNQEQLSHALFPLGEYTKPQVRQLARTFNLPVAERADSQDLCFLGSGSYQEFLSRYAPQTQLPGPIVDRQGNRLGEHNGLANFTIGQRKGIRIAAPEPFYVLSKDMSRNALIVGPRSALGSTALFADQVNWVDGAPPTQPTRLQVKVRYKAKDAWGMVTPIGEQAAQVNFEEPVRDITPGQAAVFYQDERCLGGGIIQSDPQT
jgi:tRNA-specific 2-thiouridylase